MSWPPSTPAPQMEAAGNMAGFGARRMQEEQQREADRRQQEWERAEAERRHVEFMQQQEIDRQNVEVEKQRLAWEWSELQRQQREHEDRRLQFQHEQAYVAEQQRLQYEQEQQRLSQQQQQQFLEQQHRLEQQQEALAQQQKELAEQQQAHNEAILEKQRKLKKTEVELQRKLRSQQAEAQKLQEELQQQKQLTQQQLQLQLQLEEERRQQQQELEKQQHQLQQQQELERRQHQLQQKQEVERRRHQLLQKQEAERRRQQALQNETDGDETLEAITASPAHGQADRPQPPPKKSPHRGQAAPLTIKLSEQRTQAWAAEHAETMLAWCGDCRQDVLLTQLGNHHCMRRNNSSNSSQDSSRTTELVRPSGLSAHARTPSPSAQPRSPFFERHLELERSRHGTNSPLSPALSPVWPDFHNNGRLGSNEGPLIRRTPSEDERERLISTPSPIPPDLSPEEEADIRAERKRRIEAQREAKKKGTTVVAATAIMAALKFENLARAAVPSRSMSPPSMSATVRVDNNSRMPHDKFPSNSSLASTQASSLLSAAPKYPFQRDRAYSGSSAVITPSTSYAFSAGATSSPDLVPLSASRMRTASSASQNRSAANGAAVGASSSGLRTRMDSAGAARVGRSRLDSDPAARSRLRLDTTAAAVTAVQQVTGRERLESGKRLDPLDGLGTHRLPGPALAFPDAEFVDSPVEQSRSKGLSPIKASRSKGGINGSGGDVPASSSSLEPIAAKHLASRSRSNSVSPLATRRPSLDDREASRKGTGAGASTGKVDLRGIEDLMRGLETDVTPGAKGDPRRVRERSNSGRGVQKMSAGAGPEELSPIRNVRTGGTTPRPLKAGDRLRS